MRYVIVSLIKGRPHEFHEELVNKVCELYKVKRQKLQSHFTIKAPFESENIDEVEKVTEEFCRNRKSSNYSIDKFGHFGDKVVYMNIVPSEEVVKTCEDYISSLKKISNLEWKPNEKGKRVFHCTVVSKLPPGKFDDIWSYTTNFECNFNCSFDNITIMLWDTNKWVVHKEYKLE